MRPPDPAAPLFAGWDAVMLRACLQGQMGRVVTDGKTPPESALCAVGDFCFLAGTPSPELARRADRPILVPCSPEWEAIIRAIFGARAVPFTRYAMRAPAVFDWTRLAGFAAALPPGFSLSPILPAHYAALMGQDWSRDLCGNFRDGADFARRGVGVIALENGIPAAGAASYAVCSGSIEIEIDTRPDQRRRGLALACGAGLILTCLDRGLHPGWDAHDLRSVSLAEKLGYRLIRPYPAFWLDPGPPQENHKDFSGNPQG